MIHETGTEHNFATARTKLATAAQQNWLRRLGEIYYPRGVAGLPIASLLLALPPALLAQPAPLRLGQLRAARLGRHLLALRLLCDRRFGRG